MFGDVSDSPDDVQALKGCAFNTPNDLTSSENNYELINESVILFERSQTIDNPVFNTRNHLILYQNNRSFPSNIRYQ